MDRIFDSVPTNTVDKLKRSGAPTAIAKQMKITYMSTLEAARFSTNARSRTFDAVSCRSVARLPPERMPLMMSMSVFFMRSELMRFAMSLSACSISFPVTRSFPSLSISLSNGENSSRALVSNARSMVIPARRLLDIISRKSGNTNSIFFTSASRLSRLLATIINAVKPVLTRMATAETIQLLLR